MRTEDGYIIHKCLNGDSAAFGLLVDKYKSSIFALAYFKLQNFHDAEDITQEAFIKAYKKLPTLKWGDNFLAWLYAITSNLCADLIRARSKRPDREFIADKDSGFWGYTSMDSYQEEQVYESLHEALNSLPEIYRQVLTLYYFGGMSSNEIARFLGMSPNTVDKRLSRARAKLKKEMLDMMSKTYDQHKLQPGFTFCIVEMVKQIKIQPASQNPWLPFGLSAATGIVFAVLMFSSHLISLTSLGALFGSPLPGETKVMEVGELPVDVLEISEIKFLSSEQGDGKDSAPKHPNPQNAFAPHLAPSGGEGKWTQKADMPTARDNLSANEVNGMIYAIGGTDSIKNIKFSTVEEYDPVADKWTKKADMPTVRSGHSASVVNGKIYVIGGWRNGAPIEFSTVEEYDPARDKWTKKADIPTGRQFFSTSVVDGKIYAIGGWRGGAVISAVEEYDPVADKWVKKASMPSAIQCHSTSAVNGKIYVIGGLDAGDAVLSTVEEYDPVADKWVKKADMPTARYVLSTSVVNGKIYAIGGNITNSIAVSAVEEYDPVADTWVKKADMPAARGWLSTSAVKGKIYAIGGWHPFNSLSTVEEYDTGFAGQGIDTEGKLPTTWGRLKRGN